MSELASTWAENLDISEAEAARSVTETAEALQALLPWPLVKPLTEDLHKDFERLHAHMRLMLVQALESPRLNDFRSEGQRDALALDVLDAVLSELNSYSHECAVMAVVIDALAARRDHTGAAPAADLDWVDGAVAMDEQTLREARAVLGAEVDQQRRNLRELEERLAEMDREIDSAEHATVDGEAMTTSSAAVTEADYDVDDDSDDMLIG